MRKLYKISIGEIRGRRPHGRPRCRWKDNFKEDLTEGERENVFREYTMILTVP